MKQPIKLSVTLAVYNEERNLDRCLKAVKGIADEIIIVDGKSIDKTKQIAAKYRAKVFETENDPVNFHKQKKLANDKAVGEWILQLDADEDVSPDLKNEIKEKINSDPPENGFWIPRANYFLGRFLRKGGAYPDYTMRLYRRGKGNLPADNVHEQAVVEGPVGYLKHDLLHYNNPTFGDYIEKRFNRYTDIMAREIYDSHKEPSFINYVFIKPLFDANQGFLSIYVRHLGFLDGFPGYIWALFSALHFPIAYFKYFDIKEGRIT